MPPHTAAGQSVINTILNARSATDIARYFIFPMPTQIGANLHVFNSAEELAQGYARMTKAKAQTGKTALGSRIVAIELPRKNRFRVWVDWHYTDQNGTVCTGDRSIYFCSTLRGHTAVEMIQCQKRAEPDLTTHGRAYAQA